MILNPKLKDLSDREKNITSQYGEDGIIEAIFEEFLPRNYWCVDVGASDGYMLSNTWNLKEKNKWKNKAKKQKFYRRNINA